MPHLKTPNNFVHHDTEKDPAIQMQNHAKLIDALKEKDNTFQAKYTSGKFKIMFTNINDFSEFKIICLKENIQYHQLRNQIHKH